MFEDTVVSLMKARLGITSGVRDEYLLAIVRGVIDELRYQKGIQLDESDYCHLMFVVDYATWRYQSRDETGGTPRHLQFRMHNLFLHDGGASG